MTELNRTKGNPWQLKTPPVMEALRLCEREHNPKNNRMRAV